MLRRWHCTWLVVASLWSGLGEVQGSDLGGGRSSGAPRGPGVTPGPARVRGLATGRWVPGPCVGELAGVAEIRVPAGYAFLHGDEVRRYLGAIPQPVTGREIGLVVRSGAGWYVIFSYDEVGWVSEDEKDRLDPPGMLVAIRQRMAMVNRERQRQGWSAVQILGWATLPTYDSLRHRLEWATDEVSSGRSLLEMNSRYLGRGGVMRATLVADPTRLSRTLPEYRGVMEGFSFLPGYRYGDVQPSDPRASGGLMSLVVGGGGAMAVKVGLMRWSWWMVGGVLVLGLVLLLGVDPRRKPTRARPRGVTRKRR